MQTTANFRIYNFTEVKTYLLATLFVIGNIALPQLFHAIPQGGQIWLPIFFFTLIGAYGYGWKVGLLTAILSPITNYLLFGMPSAEMVPVIICKSTILAMLCGVFSARYQTISLLILTCVVLLSQILGMLTEWAIIGNFYVAITHVQMSLAGMLLQIVGGYIFIKLLIRK